MISNLLKTDPGERYTPEQVFDHPWMKGTAPDVQLDAAQAELRKFNAKRRWKGAILTVIASNRIKTMLDLQKMRKKKPQKAKRLRKGFKVKNLKLFKKSEEKKGKK